LTLELSKVSSQVEAMGRALAAQEQAQGSLLRLARRWLSDYAESFPRLGELTEYSAARPTEEPPQATYPLPPHPQQVTIVAADGSAIQPDRHGVALYYLINIGSIVFRHGSGERPHTRSLPHIAYERDHLYEGRRLVQGNLLDVRRDTAELCELADLAEMEKGGPVVALADGTLSLWVLEGIPPELRQQKVVGYLRHLARLRARQVAVGAFVSRPRYGEVVGLLHLADLEARLGRGQLTPEKFAANPLEGLADRHLFSFLAPGERSALFVSPPQDKVEYGEHQIHFFYLNVGTDREAEIARVETPRWVAGDSASLDLLHAAVYEQCRVTGGYPYVLARAHELAVIGGQEREEFEAMITAAMLRNNITPAPSEKARLKQLMTGSRRRPRR
jgi:hypothetical protein